MIEFSNVSKIYPHGQSSALENVSLKIAEGEMVFLTGHSGAGKSTVLRIISGMEKVTAGTVYFGGNNITRLSKSQLPYYRRLIGMIFQDHKLMMNKTVAENVALPLLIKNLTMEEAMMSVEHALQKVGLLSKINTYPLYLSAGEQQRVGIARAIVAKPKVLLADEPTGNLDYALSQEIMSLFLELNSDGMTVVMATHDLDLVASSHKRSIELQYGKVISDLVI